MDEIRVGDAERSDALDRLGTLFADGYLDVGEFEERTVQAAVARTRGQAGVQIAGGVPLQVGEPVGFSTYRIGLFGLDKWADVDGIVARFAEALDKVVSA